MDARRFMSEERWRQRHRFSDISLEDALEGLRLAIVGRNSSGDEGNNQADSETEPDCPEQEGL